MWGFLRGPVGLGWFILVLEVVLVEESVWW